MNKNMISVIVPCLNEEQALPVFYREMCKVMEGMKETAFELLLVDDGSCDGTLDQMKRLSRTDGRCRYFSFSRNFGKEAAIYAGITHARGDYVAVMDVDLQDPPELLPKMYRILQEGEFDSVAARRTTRNGESWLRSRLSRCFYGCVNRISGTKIVSGARDYRLMNRKMADAVLELQEYNRFTKGIYEWVGFRTKWLEYENVKRCAGQTKWSIRKLFLYAAEGIGGFSAAPLAIAPILGVILCVASVLSGIGCAVAAAAGISVPGAALLGVLVLLIGGVQLVCSGISSWYLANMYFETKKRPIYILRESSDETSCGKNIYEMVRTERTAAPYAEVKGEAI